MQEPLLPEGVTGEGLDEDVQAELRSLVKETADSVAAHLVAAALLLDEDAEAAYQHAVYARARASRVGSVREAVGIAAYMTGRYTEALSELRAVKRIHGTDVHLPVMADCQRGLGRPERALEMAGSPEAAKLDVAGQIELRIVAAGARQDMGQLDAAVLTLQCPQLRDAKSPWSARLRYAYAEALLTAGRADEGRTWLMKAVDADVDAQTDAAERLAELDGVSFVELEELEGDGSEDYLESGAEASRTVGDDRAESAAPAPAAADQPAVAAHADEATARTGPDLVDESSVDRDREQSRGSGDSEPAAEGGSTGPSAVPEVRFLAGPENTGPENTGPENTGPENTEPENNGPDNTGPENDQSTLF